MNDFADRIDAIRGDFPILEHHFIYVQISVRVSGR